MADFPKSTEEKKSSIDYFTLLALVVASFFAVAVLSNARFWWQLPVEASSPWWFPFLLLLGVVQIRRIWNATARSISSIAVTVLVALSVRQVCSPFFALLQPPLEGKISVTADSFFTLAVLDEPVGMSAGSAIISEYLAKNPSDFVVAFSASVHSIPQTIYPTRREFNGNGIHFSIGSRLEWLPESILDFGDESLPAAAIYFSLPNGKRCWLAVLSLWETGDAQAFHINRFSLRRISTLFRNSDEAGLVVTDLKTPIFTKYYSLLARYGYLRNIWRGRLFSTEDFLLFTKLPFTGRQVLVNSKVAVKNISAIQNTADSAEMQTRVELGIGERRNATP